MMGTMLLSETCLKTNAVSTFQAWNVVPSSFDLHASDAATGRMMSQISAVFVNCPIEPHWRPKSQHYSRTQPDQ